ncbi:efflux RND transporter periplasmic adaptor subunit [Candidatus Finniella inopinata]|uniref:Efflux RND transporter periplasmic adaptor subunit n=1 Tax=Candidatus Finniella inopinata TaxID=1696036 RepID=A0A4Q7DJ86_9PROT|nr:efflux RND transporter periplasmic adaptor subunit [Candidatus Finniella inopinata]RZI46205.1 efflux RND transporter periplasmic adaptor subunit [Candidatus Finniella inopinata]
MNVKELIMFFRTNLIAVFGLLGLIGAIVYTFTLGRPAVMPPNQLTIPPSSPFTHNIAAKGLIEANTQNINIGSFVPGVVDQVMVKEGDRVKKGDFLFCLDQRTETTQLALDQKDLESAKYSVDVAKADFAEANDQYGRAKNLRTGVVSLEELKKREFSVQRTQAQLNLEDAKLQSAQEKVSLSRISLEKLTVKSPIDGLVLKVRIRPGEYINQTTQTLSPLTIGNPYPLHVRVQIDENDTWRLDPKAKVIAVLRSNQATTFPLTFIRLEPYAQPKQNLSGDSRELIDTRIVEIIYKIEGDFPSLLIGQQVDVFIEAQQE